MSEQLSEEQILDLECKIAQLPTIKKHDDDIAEIIDDLEGLKEGQNNMQADIRTLDVKVDDMAKSLKDDIRELGHSIIKKIDDREMGELRTEIRTLKKREEKDEAKKWDLVKIVTSAVVGVIITFLALRILGG